MSASSVLFLSERDLPLMLTHLPKVPTLTVEQYLKWYKLYLVQPDGQVLPVEYDALDVAGLEGYVDHVPNPQNVIQLAQRMNWEIDDLALELIIGRWHWEVLCDYEVDPA